MGLKPALRQTVAGAPTALIEVNVRARAILETEKRRPQVSRISKTGRTWEHAHLRPGDCSEGVARSGTTAEGMSGVGSIGADTPGADDTGDGVAPGGPLTAAASP